MDALKPLYFFSKLINNVLAFKSQLLRSVLTCMLVFLLVGCGGDSGNSTGPNPDPDTDPDPDRKVSFSEDILPIFQSSCAESGCHDAGTQESNVNLSSYDAALNSEGQQYQKLVINSGNPDESPLVDKVEPNPEIGARMPYQRNALSNANIDSIRAWIEDGAPDS